MLCSETHAEVVLNRATNFHSVFLVDRISTVHFKKALHTPASEWQGLFFLAIYTEG
jgi:hypothetical protein